MKRKAVVYFEIPVLDMKRAISLYQSVFAIELQQMKIVKEIA